MSRIDLYQLDDFNEDFAPNRFDMAVPVWDETGGQFKPVRFPKSPFFGDEYQFTASQTDVATSSTVPQIYLNWNTTVLPAGQYELFVQICWSTRNVTSSLEMDLLRNDVSLFDDKQNDSTANNSPEARSYVNGLAIIEVAAPASLNLKLTYRRLGSTQTVYIWNGLIRLFRIS